jgi:hypothetical protein
MAAKWRRDRGLPEQGQSKVVGRPNGQPEGAVRAYDEVYRHILALSDALSDGIIKQFPGKFGA